MKNVWGDKKLISKNFYPREKFSDTKQAVICAALFIYEGAPRNLVPDKSFSSPRDTQW